MKIKLLLFGIITDVIGSDQLILNDIINTDGIVSKIENDYPGIKKLTYRIAVNNKIINGNTILKDDDEVALLPPFSGG